MKLYVNESITIPFTVTNEGVAVSFVDIKIEDDQKFAQDPKLISKNLQPKANGTGQFIITAGPVPGITV